MRVPYLIAVVGLLVLLPSVAFAQASPESRLADDTDRYLATNATHAPYEQAAAAFLDDMAQRCTQNRSQLASVALRAQQLLEQNGLKDESVVMLLIRWDGLASVLPSDAGPQDCTPPLAAYLTLRGVKD